MSLPRRADSTTARYLLVSTVELSVRDRCAGRPKTQQRHPTAVDSSNGGDELVGSPLCSQPGSGLMLQLRKNIRRGITCLTSMALSDQLGFGLAALLGWDRLSPPQAPTHFGEQP
jgi:hypothetical protein